MTDKELKRKCAERAKIFQQAMESCHSSSPIDCIEWFADRIAELEMTVGTLRTFSNEQATTIENLQKENAELKEYNKYLKRKRQGGIQKQYNKVAIIKQQNDQLSKAKEVLHLFLELRTKPCASGNSINMLQFENTCKKAEQFISEVEK